MDSIRNCCDVWFPQAVQRQVPSLQNAGNGQERTQSVPVVEIHYYYILPGTLLALLSEQCSSCSSGL